MYHKTKPTKPNQTRNPEQLTEISRKQDQLKQSLSEKNIRHNQIIKS